MCAGDPYIYLGKTPYVSFPRVGGHEIAGHLEALGPNTAGPSPGARIVVEPFLGCEALLSVPDRQAQLLRQSQDHRCASGRGICDFLVVPVDRLFAIPSGMSAYLASFVEPVAIGVQSCRRGQVTVDDTLLILGAGPIGLALVEVARSIGARTYVSDVLPDRLEIAAQLGATTLPAGDGFLDDLMRLTNGEGMPVVIEATGNASVMEQTVGYVAAGEES